MFGVCADSVSTCMTYRLRYIHLVFGIPRQIAERNVQRTAEQDLAHTGSTTRHLRMRTLSDLNKDVVYFVSRHDHRGLYTPLPELQLFLGLSEPTPLSSEMCRHDCCVQSGVQLVRTAAGMINFVQLIIE